VITLIWNFISGVQIQVAVARILLADFEMRESSGELPTRRNSGCKFVADQISPRGRLSLSHL
jgi:hypothetical protein